MPLARYFLFVGGVLLALLFVINAVTPNLTDSLAPVTSTGSVRADSGADKSILRIRSDQKWPEAVVYDTSLPTIVPASAKAETRAPAPPKIADISPKARVREAFAQFVPPEKTATPKLQRKRKIAKVRASPPTIRVAQQPRFGLFESLW
jgi:hypothetical protein